MSYSRALSIRITAVLAIAIALVLVVLASHAEALQAIGKGPSHAKISAIGGKIDKDGKQVVTVKMQIDKGWHAYANPVQSELLDPVKTIVEVKGDKKLQDVSLTYPSGKKVVEAGETYYTYENEVEILAAVRRAAGDSGPLEVKVTYSLCDDKGCLPVESVVLKVK